MPENQKCECVGWKKMEEEESLPTQVGRLSRARPSAVAVLVQQVLPSAGKNVEKFPKRVSTEERGGYLRKRVFSGQRGTGGGLQPEESMGSTTVPQINALRK